MAPVQALVKNNEAAWPSIHELEQWLARTAGESDQFAGCLRRLVQSNPGYGMLLARDEELATIVQMFARRFRQQIVASETPIQAATLFRPLCEVVWKTTARVVVSLSELGGHVEGAQPMLPKDARGQLRTLLKTLEDLSCKFGEARREYLRELAMHRDKQRRISDSAQRVLDSLEEDPIMFYDPLESLLDDPTKEFVKQVVEERIKLEMQAGLAKKQGDASGAAHGDVGNADSEVFKLQQEMRQLRILAAKAEDALKRQEQAERQAREEAARAKGLAAERQAQVEELQRQLEAARQQQAPGASRRGSVQAAAEEKRRSLDRGQAEEALRELRERLAQREGLLEELQRKLA